MTTDLLNNLNEQQRAAVSAPPGPTLVVAGPGSGKTAVLTRRVAYLVRELNVPAWRIMAVTFTNKAAKEMTHRIESLLGLRIGGLNVGTFHAICARILRREAEHVGLSRSYVIYDTDDQLALMKKAIVAAGLDPEQVQPRAQLSRISAAKNELINPEEYPNVGYTDRITFKVYPVYQKMLREGNGVDFDDLLMNTVMLFRRNAEILEHYQNAYDHILVDEFQDTNTAQYALVKMLAGERRNLFCVGDPDQSIYRFRGADYRNVMRFQSDFPDVNVILLEQNYRSHQIILDAAMAIIDKNTDRIRKQLTSSRQEGPKIALRENLNEDYEAMYIAEKVVELVNVNGYQLKDCAIMYRMNAQSRSLEESFLRMKIPYRLLGGVRFYGRKEVKDVLAYLRLIDNPTDAVSLLRILNVPARGIGAKTQAELEKWAASRGSTLLGAIQDAMKGVETPFGTRAQKNLTDFGALIATWQETRNTTAIGSLLRDVLSRTAYLQSLNDGTPEGDERVANVNELIGLAESRGEMKLTEFLEEIALVSDVDTYDETADSLVMLTLHTAKGLEFPIVFIVGLEEGTLPHARALDDPEQLSEERRLMYVGITRAKDRLYLTWAHQRVQYGMNTEMLSSRFLGEIPEALTSGSPVPGRGRSREERESYRRATTWDSGGYPQNPQNGGSSKPWSPPKPGWNNPPRRPNRYRR